MTSSGISLTSAATTSSPFEKISSLSADFRVYNCDEAVCPTKQYLFWATKNSTWIASADCEEPDVNATTVCKCNRPFILAGCEHIFKLSPSIYLAASYIFTLAYLYMLLYALSIIRRKTSKARRNSNSAICCLCNRVIAGTWIVVVSSLLRAVWVGVDPQHWFLVLPETVYNAIFNIFTYLTSIAQMLVFESWLSFIAINTSIKQRLSERSRDVILYSAIGLVSLIAVVHILVVVLPFVSDSVKGLVRYLSLVFLTLFGIVLATVFTVVGCMFSRRLHLTHWQNERLRQISDLSRRCLVGISVVIVIFAIAVPTYSFFASGHVIGWTVLQIVFRINELMGLYLLLRLFEGEHISKFGVLAVVRTCKRLCERKQTGRGGRRQTNKSKAATGQDLTPSSRTQEFSAAEDEARGVEMQSVVHSSHQSDSEEPPSPTSSVYSEMPSPQPNPKSAPTHSQDALPNSDKSADHSEKSSSPQSAKVFTFAAKNIAKSIKKNSPRLGATPKFMKSTPRKGSLVRGLLDDSPRDGLEDEVAAPPLPNGLTLPEVLRTKQNSASPNRSSTSPSNRSGKVIVVASPNRSSTSPKRSSTSPNRSSTSPNRSSTSPNRGSGKVFNSASDEAQSQI